MGGWLFQRVFRGFQGIFLEGGNVNSLGVWNVPPPPPGDAENQFRLQVFNKVKIMSPAKKLRSGSPLSCGDKSGWSVVLVLGSWLPISKIWRAQCLRKSTPSVKQ